MDEARDRYVWVRHKVLRTEYHKGRRIDVIDEDYDWKGLAQSLATAIIGILIILYVFNKVGLTGSSICDPHTAVGQKTFFATPASPVSAINIPSHNSSWAGKVGTRII